MAVTKQLWKRRSPRFVAIVGGSGAGKSWLAERLLKAFGKDAGRISLDDFYKDRSHLPLDRRERINFDHPRAIEWELVEEVLGECSSRKAVRLPLYDFATHTRQSATQLFKVKPIIIFDGLWLLHRPSVRRRFDLKIFIQCPSSLRLDRRLQRDCVERGRNSESVTRQFMETVAPMHELFVEPQRRWADIIINHTASSEHLQELIEQLRTLLK